jgi:heme exporter protein B
MSGGQGSGVGGRGLRDESAAESSPSPTSPSHALPDPRPPTPSPPGILHAAWLIARKDLLIEFRTRTAFFSALVFSLLAVVIFYFAWDPTAVTPLDLAPGVLWVIFTFSGLLGLHRSFGVELADRAMDGLLSAPVDREAVYLGKALANLAFVLGVQAIAIPAVALFYNVPLQGGGPALAGIAVLAAVGLVAVGTLFSAMTVNTRLAELLLPVLALPFFVPIVIPAAQATAKLLAGRPVAEAAAWLKVLLGFDIVFVFACAAAFPYTIEE